ncbi:MAG TPA: ImmA/IrrE family metallo-endopeptidase [Geminicoccus sp.]|jgi:hypothetical protein|uniref:ImmA/IrrE family metallo-endopeptidase n=1 Tax=Geminicoccus sp. TaxID=2024832 RepID=UPI002E355FBB|nr:ImmA/IrrE family metallo-endopeptidase [Geminicoccus sp.]HEX2528265.1 ImmA/IrrE family metallo-endopeptidase [Geminicoccus sp.]
MTELVVSADPLSTNFIESIADYVREICATPDPFLPIVDILEFGLERLAPGYVFEVRSVEELGRNHGQVDPIAKTLALREDVYEGLVNDVGRDRFTAAHELGHALLHGRSLNRSPTGTARKIYCDPEWQANTFAAALLMPQAMVKQMKSLEQVSDEFGVSDEAAAVRVRKLGLTLPRFG